ncbi:unnamed protein product [Ambrosiozyma monospora]|uniref:Unnamed protein product n=1 Tax=Ambrosiozyma monospora TaxID=43982 RepID=A0ACB5TDX5_AMBMO|nr:unnamed protein product [Ambrosiozyma monospora]
MFYKVWSGFQTVKTFAWCDEYRYSAAPDRRTRRLMEKENKKAREQARKEYNEAVRKLVSFIKKKDPRTDPAIQKKYEQEKLKKQQAELKEQAKREKKERQRQREQFEEQEWQSVDPDELAEIEAQLHKIYEEEKMLNGENSDDDSVNEDFYECIICDKTFKSEKQFKAHENSKKHAKLLKKMQWEMRKEGIELGIDESGYVNEEIDDSDFDEFDDAVENLDDLDELDDIDLDNLDEEELDELITQMELEDSKLKGNTTKEGKSSEQELPKVKPTMEKTPDIDDDIDSDLDYPLPSKSKKSKNDTDEKLAELNTLLEKSKLDSDDDDWYNDSKKNKKKGKKSKQSNGNSAAKTSKVKTKTANEASEKCTVCSEVFSSRNKLFQHINETGHALAPKSKKGKKRGKRK